MEQNTNTTNRKPQPIGISVVKQIERKLYCLSIRLSDEGKNGVFTFYARMETKEKNPNNGHFYTSYGKTADPTQIFPRWAEAISLDGCNSWGQPHMKNSFYFLQTKSTEEAAQILGITPEQAATLCKSDFVYFKYQLFTLGIIDGWREKAARVIEQMNAEHEKNGSPCRFCDYPEPCEHFTATLTEAERAEVEERIKSGYYTPEAIAQREADAAKAKADKERAQEQARMEKAIKEARKEFAIKSALIADFGTADNVIIYHHKGEILLNWSYQYSGSHYGKIYTPDEVRAFKARHHFKGYKVSALYEYTPKR